MSLHILLHELLELGDGQIFHQALGSRLLEKLMLVGIPEALQEERAVGSVEGTLEEVVRNGKYHEGGGHQTCVGPPDKSEG